MRHEAVAHREILDPRRVDVVAAADDQVLLAPDDFEAALGVEAAEIAAHEPALAVERFLGRLLVVAIPDHQTGPAPADLADFPLGYLAVRVFLIPQPDFIGAAGSSASRDDR